MLLDRKLFFIKEQVDFMKLAGTYDIFDPDTNQQIGVAKEEPGQLIKLLRLLINKLLLPTTVNVYDLETNAVVFSIKKPFSFLRSRVEVRSRDGEFLGYFKSKLITLGGGFWVYDATDRQVAEIKGDWKGWNFKLLSETGLELGTITKKWAGIAKEFFTSADNYVIALNENENLSQKETILLLAAGLAIDIVFKEK
ncbi:MAG TPA: phospholipid scramblase-related protein [Bacillota bacterium]|jgi:uncharacterized protein YxjI|nr:phospholipid scramblase-related protein [Bacillota bacterium]HOL11041.1 phospholipid scramblase-related protein [Bacillota bacterium]HPO98793.1 phospholipid scramblase-related protein [Bacillota bacterium]